MTPQTKYSGSFVSLEGNIWTVDIWQMADNPFPQVGELDFPAEEPVLIEWEDTQKHDVICPSSATIKIESPGDRTYIDLYAVNPGDIGTNIYRNGSLYWQGTLDTELYEEPYEREKHYDVLLTFQDFGPWARLKFDMHGLPLMGDIINDALYKAKLSNLQLDTTSFISSFHQRIGISANPAEPFTLRVRADNFYDKDGQPLSLEEVITGMLQPLAQRIIQKNGAIYVYDLQGLHDNAQAQPISWTADSQTLSTDRIYNKVKVSLDPNASGKLLDPDDLTIDIPDDSLTNVSNFALDYFTFYSSYQKSGNNTPIDPSDLQFTIFTTTNGKGLQFTSGLFFKTVGLFGGQDDKGILGCFVAGHDRMAAYSFPPTKGTRPEARATTSVLMRSNRVFIPNASSDNRKWMLRLKLEMLCDMRYNPFCEPGNYNEQGNYDQAKTAVAYAYVPADLILYDAPTGGNPIAAFDNKWAAANRQYGADSTVPLNYANIGHWVPVNAAPLQSTDANCWLAFYNKNNKESRRGSTGILGWTANHQQIGARDGRLLASITDIPDGEYIPYPQQGGWLEVTIWANLFFYNDPSYTDGDGYTFNFSDAAKYARTLNHSNIRWLLYKAPQLDIVSNGARHEVADADDVITEGVAVQGAEEDLEIKTICGTMPKESPSARAQIFRNSNKLPLKYVTRAGVTDTPERLLVRTLTAQYGARRTTLSGEAAITPGPPCVFTEQNQGQRAFVLLGEAQDLIHDTTEGLWCELGNDTDADSQVQEAQWSTFLVNTQCLNVTIDTPAWVAESDSLHAIITPWQGHAIASITVMMGQQDITQQALQPREAGDNTAEIIIPIVTDEILITATADPIQEQ